ncbi:hypothetical protein [Noviherbaspirillum aridicola]|uniref:Small CPxCG-related zinc finger protein n=1 Tax=Noviherbaspirillum aridicola TaxID=2849687 RepID=A0ABQ4Q727_9BURK|nr:hypothetical protein [Noviherbaspirillum aridicola]GIZ52841.1 hypothetical protein NCCP691_28550 [Noviherbaspirillum aridicola]
MAENPCPACAALENAPVTVSPHARLLLHSDAPINFSATATGYVEYYVCHDCGMQWERARARSEPGARWQHSSKPLE